MSTYPNEQRQENAPAGNTDKSVCLPEGAKRQIDTVAGGSSITDIKEQAVSATGQKLGDAKQTILNDVVPAATGALQNVQENLCSIAGGDNAVNGGQSKEGGYFLLSLRSVW